ncbi:MAG: sulfatase-like hydrolase/transferase [Candidatus Solibacter sp.]
MAEVSRGANAGSLRNFFLVALSFANVCYLRIWSELLTYTRSDVYLMVTPPKPVEYFALMANVLLTGAFIWGLSLLARRFLQGRNFRFAEMAVVLSLCIPLNALRTVLSARFPYLKSPLIGLLGLRGVMVLAACLAVVGVIALVWFHRKLAAWTGALLLALSPFCAVTFGQALWRAAHYDAREYANKPATPMIQNARKFPRVVWFIADEWDYRLSFVDRDPSLTMPELDRLRQSSIFAVNAIPPGTETPISIPAYYSGRIPDFVVWDGPRELQLHLKNPDAYVPWSGQPNIFQRAGGLGVNTALVEWFHPSCRILTGLSYCNWRPMAMQYNSMGEGFWRILMNQQRSLFETTMFSVFGRSLSADQQTGVYKAILRESETVSNNEDFAFTVIHLPVPHSPHAYNRKTGEFTLGNAPIAGYVDSLALLDRTVGEIRRSMETAGTWDSTTVLFTSDHPYREARQVDGKSDPRIPYVLKLAAQKQGVVYPNEFNTVVTGDLLLGVLRGEITDPASATAWLDRQRVTPVTK